MNKEERINAEFERLSKLFETLDANQLQTARGLIKSAAFLAVSLEDLEAEINANGYIDTYTNGASQAGEKISAAVQAYTALNAKYQSTMQKLLKIVPPAPKKPKKAPIDQPAVDLEAEDRREKYEEQRRKSNEIFYAFCKAYPNDATPENYKKFKEEWDRQNAK